MPEVNPNKIHNFNPKLLQTSAVNKLKRYVKWQRAIRSSKTHINSSGISPISINLDLTTTCNFACSHCVDLGVLNSGDILAFEKVKSMMDTLHSEGLKSVILIGGGEPTLHRRFGEIVRYIKSLGIQLAIVTNGSRMDKIIEICDCLDAKDWIRLSLDAGTDDSFQVIHQPRMKVSLKDICESVRKVTDINKNVSVGFSYIAIWQGCKINNMELLDNIDEIPQAVQLAKESGFEYFSVKPCLIKLEDSRQESLLFGVGEEQASKIAARIKQKVIEANKVCGDGIRIVESTNLLAMFNSELDKFKEQNKMCHMQFFRQVVTPLGIFHCPAYRGEPQALLADKNGYNTKHDLVNTIKATENMVLEFNAEEECKDIVCLYNPTNKWIEELIDSDVNLDSLETVEDDNFFL